ncbi:MAG TPA: S9 family peptidase, partial [Microscillaceae bacterium]|nr:S9 family peptidase [Microscillaceae bacterium]
MNRITLFLLAMLVWLASPAAQAQKLNYPKTAQVKHIDNYFGTDVADPYRWLEVSDSAAVKDWIKEQNKVTFEYLAQIPFRENLKQRLTQIWNYPKVGAPFKRGDYYYFYKNDGLQNQSILYRQKTLGGEAEAFLDPNT